MSQELYTVELLDNEKNLRFNGELADDDWWINKTGIFGEIEFDTDYYLYDDCLYFDGPLNVYRILEIFGRFEAPEKYDRISNSGYGEVAAHTKQKILGKSGSFIVSNPEYLKDVLIVPYEQFKIDHPNFDQKEYEKIIASLDHYYETNK